MHPRPQVAEISYQTFLLSGLRAAAILRSPNAPAQSNSGLEIANPFLFIHLCLYFVGFRVITFKYIESEILESANSIPTMCTFLIAECKHPQLLEQIPRKAEDMTSAPSMVAAAPTMAATVWI